MKTLKTNPWQTRERAPVVWFVEKINKPASQIKTVTVPALLHREKSVQIAALEFDSSESDSSFRQAA